MTTRNRLPALSAFFMYLPFAMTASVDLMPLLSVTKLINIIVFYTPYSEMATILVFVCLIAN